MTLEASVNTIERKVLFAELSRGAAMYARRIVPFPHRHTLELNGRRWTLDDPTAERLVNQKFVLPGKPIDALWDNIEFKPDIERAKDEALTWWENGFGWCAACSLWISIDAKARAVRHGHVKQDDGKYSAPCAGTGKPLVDVVRPTIEAAHAA